MAVVVLRTGAEDPAAAPDLQLPSPSSRQALASVALADVVEGVADADESALARAASSTVAQRLLENGQDLRIVDFSLRYVDEDRALSARLPEGQWAAAVDASWRLDGFDPGAARTEITVTFALDGQDARIVGFGGGARRTPLWLLSELAVERSDDSLVMVAGGGVGDFATQAKEAVRVVAEVLPASEQKLVVEVPADTAQLHALLDADEGAYENIAAVTVAVDGTLAPSAPVHVLVNPQLWSGLEPQGAQVVMSHEAVHVATGAATTSGVPLWLLEGFADYVALRGVDLPLSRAAAQVIAQVRADGLPDSLPGSNEFNTRTTHLGAAYEAAWLACRVLVEAGSEASLVALYADVSSGADVADALRVHFGLGPDELVTLWQGELERLADENS